LADVADFKGNIALWVWSFAATVTGGTLAGLLGQLSKPTAGATPTTTT
jgi:hypothetical protein